MNGAIAWFANNRVAANLLMWLLVIGGLLVMPGIPQHESPEPDPDVIIVQVEYRGHGMVARQPFEFAFAHAIGTTVTRVQHGRPVAANPVEGEQHGRRPHAVVRLAQRPPAYPLRCRIDRIVDDLQLPGHR